MRRVDRIDPFLEELGKVWKKNPDLRFGQLIYVLADKMNQHDIFFPEEDEWLEGVKLLDEESK